jgi:hypothetical protein
MIELCYRQQASQAAFQQKGCRGQRPGSEGLSPKSVPIYSLASPSPSLKIALFSLIPSLRRAGIPALSHPRGIHDWQPIFRTSIFIPTFRTHGSVFFHYADPRCRFSAYLAAKIWGIIPRHNFNTVINVKCTSAKVDYPYL